MFHRARGLGPYLLLASLIPACSAAPPTAAPPPPAPPASAPPEPTPTPAPPPQPGGHVTEVVAPSANTPYARVKMEFENPGPKPCRFERYAVSWGSARKEITLEDLLIPAGERRERWLKVHPEDGDLGALSKDARVEVKTRCE